ncbi:hypothetical protein [Streptomyces sp. NPDC047525]|uniref:hypothetical protein n=1 Tax=Streptomyces sp. NPDC047525 TaxID=3155264 RepID=UPI0033EB39C0
MTITSQNATPAGCTWNHSIPTASHGGGYVAPGRYVLVVPGRTWSALPAECPVSELAPGEWIGQGEAAVLVCTGCGLNVT